MKRSFTTIGTLLLVMLFVVAGCGKKTTEQTVQTGTCVYYINQSGSDLTAEPVTLPDGSRTNQLKFLLEQLVTPPVGKSSPLPEGTKLNNVTVKDDIAVVDFSKEFKNEGGTTQSLAPAAVVKTLCSVEYISGVQILIDGTDTAGADGKSLGIMREGDLVLKSEPSPAPKTVLTLYFSDENSEYLVAESRNLELPKGSTVEKAVVEELIKGPTEGGHYKTIPDGTKLISVETKDRVCYVNLSKEFVDKLYGGVSAEKLAVYSVVNSLTELGTVEKVQFLIEGEKIEELNHMSSFNEPFAGNPDLIKQ